ncbi:uncharacterized protein [Nicotiana sylvestris]|uniref:Uncharacterized protein n=1 Tax=Nicotiana tabacum TaxID=4097 RepID=A0A1S4D1S9_TOBAC|nr:PREDICTED: uncharacterized protein LOC107825073 [Nicotiana tabacum]
MAGDSSRDNLPAANPTPENVSQITGGADVVEDEEVPSVIEILARLVREPTDFNTPAGVEPEPVHSVMRERDIVELKERWGIPGYVDMRPAVGKDIVHFDCPGYCVFYAYPFIVGYTLPLPLLVVDFCRFYEVCPAQLSPYLYKIFLMLLKYAELASREVTLDHMLSIFAPQLIRGSMIHMCPRGSRGLVVKMDDRTNRRFYENYFYVRTEHIVADPTGFPERWNSSPERLPPLPVEGIREWVEAILPHTVGIRT